MLETGTLRFGAGAQMVVWGGYNGTVDLNTGGRYNPANDTLAATTVTAAPDVRSQHTAVWTGSEMIVWGGEGSGLVPLNTGGRYCAVAQSPTPTPTVTATATPTASPSCSPGDGGPWVTGNPYPRRTTDSGFA